MTTEEIVKLAESSPDEAIAELKSHRKSPLPDVSLAQKALDIRQHDVNNETIRPNRQVTQLDPKTGEEKGKKPERVVRISVPMQKKIVRMSAAFCFGNPVNYEATPENDDQRAVMKAFSRILYGVKANPLTRKLAKNIFGYRECAEYWYPVETRHSKYGFEARHKLRCVLWSPCQGDTLYPYFDEMGDMTAFSRAFSKETDTGKTVEFFETFTKDNHYLWVSDTAGTHLAEGYPKPVAIGKIPVVYGSQDHYETEDVDNMITRLEFLLSNFGDTNDYHSSPKIFTTGNIYGWMKRGDAGAVIQGEPGATMQYVSWADAPESVKLEINTLLKLIHSVSQTPEIDIEAVQGLGAISGIALKLLFMDAHLKVLDKREIFDDYLARRVSIILSYIGEMNNSLKKAAEEIMIEPEIVPYIITSDMDELTYWMTANGNKAVISQEESVEKAGLTASPEQTMEKLRKEAEEENSFSFGEPVNDA